MATRVITVVFSLTPQELQAEVMRLLLMASHEGVKEIPFTVVFDLLERDIGVPERILASSQEVQAAVQELQTKGLINYDKGTVSLPG